MRGGNWRRAAVLKLLKRFGYPLIPDCWIRLLSALLAAPGAFRDDLKKRRRGPDYDYKRDSLFDRINDIPKFLHRVCRTHRLILRNYDPARDDIVAFIAERTPLTDEDLWRAGVMQSREQSASKNGDRSKLRRASTEPKSKTVAAACAKFLERAKRPGAHAQSGGAQEELINRLAFEGLKDNEKDALRAWRNQMTNAHLALWLGLRSQFQARRLRHRALRRFHSNRERVIRAQASSTP